MALPTDMGTWYCAGVAAVALLMVLMNGIDSSMSFMYCIMVFIYFILFFSCFQIVVLVCCFHIDFIFYFFVSHSESYI